MRLRKVLAAAILLVTVGGPALATAAHSCDSNPDCNGGRGAVRGYVCVRSEINTEGDEFNGRICERSPDPTESWYVYLRALVNREWVIVCRNEEEIASAPQQDSFDHCKYAGGDH